MELVTPSQRKIENSPACRAASTRCAQNAARPLRGCPHLSSLPALRTEQSIRSARRALSVWAHRVEAALHAPKFRMSVFQAKCHDAPVISWIADQALNLGRGAASRSCGCTVYLLCGIWEALGFGTSPLLSSSARTESCSCLQTRP